jgi:hypothetical protein
LILRINYHHDNFSWSRQIMSKKLNQPIADINEAWVMAEAEKPYQERIVAAHQIAKFSLQAVIESGNNIEITKKRMTKLMGVSKFAIFKYKLLDIDQILYPQSGAPAIIDTINYVFYNNAKHMPALEIARQAQGLPDFFGKYSKREAKESSKTYRLAQEQLTIMNKQN